MTTDVHPRNRDTCFPGEIECDECGEIFVGGPEYCLCPKCAELFDDYGNPKDGSRLINCCFPDCGCDGARLCNAENGPSQSACWMNIERGTKWQY